MGSTFKIMTASAAFGLAFWFVDGVHMYFHFDSHLHYMLTQAPLNLADALFFRVPPAHLVTRLVFTGCMLLGGVYMAQLVGTLTTYHKELLKKINERDAALQEATETKERLECFFGAAFEGIVVSVNGTFVDCNKKFTDMFGYTTAEIMGKPVTYLVHDDDKPLVEENIRSGFNRPYEHRALHKDGSTLYVEVHGNEIKYQTQIARITTIHDLTDRKKQEEELRLVAKFARQKSKMEAIGDFASGIAHDFNNALTPVIGGCEVLLHNMPASCDNIFGQQIRSILSAATTASQLVRRMQSYTRGDTSNHALPLDLSSCLTETFEFLRSMTPTSIRMDMHVEYDVGLIMATEVTVRQVMMNVVKNAIHAMPFNEGSIEINVSQERIIADTDNLNKGEYVRIDIEDNGSGMPPEVLERAMDPYYTTKADGVGTGIGLSVVNAIVKGYGGGINIYSEEGQGTRVVIYLPSIEENKEMTVVDCVMEDIIIGNREHILVVEDEKYVLNIIATILESLNYRVTTFESPHLALEEFSQRPNDFDLLVTDMTMPGLTGVDLINEVRGLRPEMKVILCSGLGSSNVLSSSLFTAKDINAYMTKPVTRAQYSKTVAEVLAKVTVDA